jgi:hypothetical protein
VSRAECSYPESRRGRKKLDRVRKSALEDRMARMEAMIEVRHNVPSLSPDMARSGSLSSHNLLQGRSLSRDVDVTSTWNDTEHTGSMSMDISVLESSPAMSFASGKPTLSRQRQPTSNVEDSMIQETPRDFPVGQFGSKHNVESAVMDKEAIILAPQMVIHLIKFISYPTNNSRGELGTSRSEITLPGTDACLMVF